MKLFSTFSGVGGFELSLQRAIGKKNVDIVGYSEIDKFAIQTYEQHFDAKNYGSIVDINIPNLPDFDLLTGGFPCQDVSVAGKQNLEGGRTVLVEYLLQMLEIKQPKYFVFENVKGLMGKKFTTFRESIFERIRLAGYDFRYQILNTKDYGVPQNRERVFIVGCRDGLDGFEYPEKEELTVFLKDILEENRDNKYYMDETQIKGVKKSNYRDRKPYNINSKYIGTLKIGGDVKRIYDNNIRFYVTPTEYERLQSFPDGRGLPCSNSQRYKQMGNAISVNVVEKLFRRLLN